MSQTAPAQARAGYRRRRGVLALLAALAVAVVFAALVIAGPGGAGLPRLLLGGIVIGGGVLFSMDFVGMAAKPVPAAAE